ncbi:MAG: CPBP family intramembrane metalloprotease [Myxococcales bacterium]|nr:CPBP family intramembrane metalloprotease [Myxococcales bacterium]
MTSTEVPAPPGPPDPPGPPSVAWPKSALLPLLLMTLGLRVLGVFLAGRALPFLVPFLIMNGALLVALVGIAWRLRLGPAAFGLGRVSGSAVALGLLAGLLAQPVFALVAAGVRQLLGLDVTNPQVEQLFADAGESMALLGLIAVVGGLTPFVEELLFRGALLPATASWYGPTTAIVATSVVFGYGHSDPGSMVGAGLLGFVAALIRLRVGSLWPAIAMHVSFNLTAIALTMMARAG